MKEKEKKELRCGVSTGASAAAAARAAALLLFTGEKHERVTVVNPQGVKIEVPVKTAGFTECGARAVVVKDGGDDPDVTNGLEIVADLGISGGGFTIRGGEGVGTVTVPGLPVPVGRPAINPVPARMIREAVEPLIPPGTGVTVTISVPGGREAAKRTLNQRLGIVGGISILGTTGIVRPMSVEALKDSLVPFVRKAAALGLRRVVLTPGGSGYRQAVEDYGFHPDAVIEMSNYVGFMLERCVENMIESVILWGQIGKIAKVAGGIFNTHSRVADGRREILAAYAALHGAKKELVARILNINTLEGAVDLVRESGLDGVFDHIAAVASRRAQDHVWGRIRVATVITARDGGILGMDGAAEELGRLMGCKRLR
ncbi:MAG: cobalt-precorrin-5B (C(1))-methyltransferase CbiD [Peptococcaceae bacterium]|nr:cobalt-precorrin-5B (C(1))-methyltransferase CbiD [Peptococcaceae bacterium]